MVVRGVRDGGVEGEIRIVPVPVGASVALDTGTRDIGDAAATRRRVTALATRLPGGEALRFAKLDSLLRGHGAAEVAAWMAVDCPDHCIVAPAFPFQGRVTRDGRQHARSMDGWTAVASDLAAALEAEGERVRLCRPGDPVPPGVSLWDAETDADLAGALLPGVPCSTLRGGAWSGVRVVSKSGAFGDPALLRRLIRGDAPDADRAAPEPTRHGTPWPHRGERA
ncbi:four-carbon acid sugar kinase family protein [Azospirillum brasilense]|uniref:four-carbon acid sugar kinase family protein n=1 Tax=Azospirillum brasilense TaxID=192 RepID=UPI001EDA7993|nr:four-carbon acid sugar kinase family protein [Azospirillum brasilense]UKJ76624.1 hypothetical protein H1Q64_23060 [Azospirillum brasilense]